MRTIIVDDNYMAIKNLRKIVEELNENIEIISEITEAENVIKEVEKLHPDLIFMDIDLARGDKLNGLVLAEQANEINPSGLIIYATAHANYVLDAINGFATVIGYLIKPFQKQNVMRTMNKLSKYIENNRLIVKDKEGTSHYIPHSNIYIIEKDQCTKYTIIHCKDQDIYTMDSLSDFELKLNQYNNFVRSHRSYIINKNFVKCYINHNITSMIVKFNNIERDALITKEKALTMGLVS